MTALQPIEHPSVWVGEELFERPEWWQELNAAEQEELRGAASEIRTRGCAADDSFDAQVARQIRANTPQLTARLADIQHALEHGCGAALIRGVPLHEFDLKTQRQLFWLLATGLGTPVPQAASGERMFSVRDAGLSDDDPRSRGPMTRRGLTFHSDRCDVIAFLCLQQARRGGENEVVSTPALYNALLRERPDLLETLMQPYLYQRHNVDLGNERPYYEQPIFAFHEGRFAGFLMQVLIERAYTQGSSPAMTPQQREALDLLQAKAGEMAAALRQEPGDILLLNNLVTLHRRCEFEDYEQPERKRHLLRIWLAMPNSRPLAPAFAPTFGTTEAGAVRGGMKVAKST